MGILSKRQEVYTIPTWSDMHVGTKLKVHSKDWFDNNYQLDEDSDYKILVTKRDGCRMSVYFSTPMTGGCDEIVTVTSIEDGYMRIENSGFCWYPEMFECIV